MNERLTNTKRLPNKNALNLLHNLNRSQLIIHITQKENGNKQRWKLYNFKGYRIWWCLLRLWGYKNISSWEEIFMLQKRIQQRNKTKNDCQLIPFWCDKLLKLRNLLWKISMPNRTYLKIKTHIVAINVPFLIGLHIFMEHGMKMDFNNHQLTCKQEKMENTITLFKWPCLH